MTTQDLQKIIDLTLNFCVDYKKIMNYEKFDFNDIKFLKNSTDFRDIYKNIDKLIEDEDIIINKELWNSGTNYLKNNYLMTLNHPDLVLDDILGFFKILMSLTKANIKVKQNETE